MNANTHLWEVDHPYYCNESNYYSNECHSEFESWTEFFEAWGENDADLNLVFRWDWQKPDPENYETGEDVPTDTLQIFWMLQRKGRFYCTEVRVIEADEPAVRDWLQKRYDHLKQLWTPLDQTSVPRAFSFETQETT